MKNVMNSAMILAASAIACGMTAFAGQPAGKMTAEIPFAFRIGSEQYPAGTYETSVVSGNVRMVTITNVSTGQARLAVPAGSLYAANAAGRNDSPRLVFKCSDSSGCALAQLWPGNAATGMLMRTPAVKGGEQQHLAVIGLRPVNAD
jgi:hypothetical protein